MPSTFGCDSPVSFVRAELLDRDGRVITENVYWQSRQNDDVGDPDRDLAFVLNQCNPTTQARTLDAATALVSTGALAPSMVATRSDFLDSMTTGQGVTELAPKGKAAVEVRLLWQWIKAQLGGAKA